MDEIGAGERHHRGRGIPFAGHRLEQLTERHRSFVEQGLQDAHAQADRNSDVIIGSDQVRVGAARLAPDLFGRHNKGFELEFTKRDQYEAFVLDVAHAPRRDDVKKI